MFDNLRSPLPGEINRYLWDTATMATPDWVASNAYRTLGLPANAGPTQVHAAAASLRRAASLGMERTLESDPSELGTVRRMEPDIRAAVGRLENPAQRLQDRLFWFSRTTEAAKLAPETVRDAAAAHDEALSSLFAAVKSGCRDIAPSLWTKAIRDWHAAVSGDDYWDGFQQTEIEANFEPAALPSEIDALRGRATSMAAAPLLRLGQTALDAGNVTLAGKIAACIASLSDTGGWSNAALDELVEPALRPLLARCEEVETELEATLKREPDAASHNKVPCGVALARFRNEIGPGLDLLHGFAPSTCDGILRARETAARCLASIASATTWADDFVRSDELYREALALAEGTVAVFKIEQDLEGIQDSVRRQRIHTRTTRDGSSSPSAKAKANEGKLEGPTLAPFLDICDNVRSELDSRIRREAGAALENVAPCSTAFKRFRKEISPALEIFLAAIPERTDAHQRAREAAARCLASIASATTWADDFAFAEKLYLDALALAKGTMASAMIDRAIKENAENARRQRLRGKPIQSAPPLFTFNGVGVTLYGHADPDPQTGSYVATHYFVIFMVPIFPIGRYRVIAQSGRRFQFLGKQPFRPLDRWWLGLALGAIALLFLSLVVRSQPQSIGAAAYPNAPAADAAAAASDAVAPTYATAPLAAAAGGATSDVAAPTAAPAGTGMTPGSDATGLKALIEVGRTRMAAIKIQLADLDAEIEPLTGTMTALKSEIDALNAQQQAGQPVDELAYNGTVDQYNNTLSRRHNLVLAYNELVAENNKLLEDDKAMVARYNSGNR